MPEQTYQPSPRLSFALLSILTVLAGALRLANLSTEGLWFDEAATWSQVNGSFYQMLSDTISDNYPPLYNTVTWLFVQAFGEAEWVLRLPAASFGIALVPMVYLLGTRVAGRTAGLLAALLIGFSAFHLWYSVEARMYSLLALTACAYAWAALRDIELQTRASGWTLVGTGVALLMSHPYGALDWFAVSAAALVLAGQRRRLIGYLAVTCGLFLPFALALLVHAYEITGRGFWIHDPTPEYILQQFLNLTSSLLPGMVLFAIAAFLPRRTSPANPALTLLLSLAVLPAILAYAASLLTRPVFLDRYLIGSLAPFAVLAAAGVVRWMPTRWLLSAAAVVIAVAAAVGLVYATPPARPDWRGAIASMLPLGPNDCVMLRTSYAVWRYYADAGCVAFTVEEIPKPASRIIYAAGGRNLDNAELDELAKLAPLHSTREYRGITVYEFGSGQIRQE